MGILVHNWAQAHKMWSVWTALFWAAFSGAYVALPAFSALMPLWLFGLLCVVMPMVIVVARLLKQPGLD